MDQEHTATVEVDGIRVHGTITASGIIKWNGESLSASLIVQKDLLGFSKGTSSIILHTFQFRSPGCCGNGVQRERKDIVFTFDGPENRELWCDIIQQCLNRSGRPKRLFIIVNPFSGKGKAQQVCKDVVVPLLEVAGIHVTKRETHFQLHAKDMAKSLDISLYDGILCVSGDGILVEVLNGLLERDDWEHAIKIPLGVVPAGSGNGMAKSLLDAAGEPCNIENATFAVIRGHTQPIDVATISQGQIRFYSMLMLTWGFVADVDIESERYRWMGGLRFDFYSILRILRLRRYNGTFAYIPAPGFEHTGASYNGEMESFRLEHMVAESEANRTQKSSGYCKPATAYVKSDWRIMDGLFIMVLLQNVPWASEDFKAAYAAKFSDGFLDLIVVKDCHRFQLLGLLQKLQAGKRVNSKYVEYIKVKAFQIAPGGRVGSAIQGGYIDVDGEVIARGRGAQGDNRNDMMAYGPTVEVNVEEGLATMFCPPQ